jgi:hypothetical protein
MHGTRRRLLAAKAWGVKASVKHLLALLCLILWIAGYPASAADVQFIPLQDYINRDPGFEKDPAAMGYVADRCAAFYIALSKGLEQETDPQRQQFRNEVLNPTAEKFMGVAVKFLMIGTTIELKDAMKRTQQTEVAIATLYIDRIAAAKARTNYMYDDPLLAGDLAICKSLLAKLQGSGSRQ